jgi:hypothetical protein
LKTGSGAVIAGRRCIIASAVIRPPMILTVMLTMILAMVLAMIMASVFFIVPVVPIIATIISTVMAMTNRHDKARIVFGKV